MPVCEAGFQPGQAPVNGGGNSDRLNEVGHLTEDEGVIRDRLLGRGSVIPCRLIAGLHEGLNDLPTVPGRRPANPPSRCIGRGPPEGREDPVDGRKEDEK